MRIFLTFVLFQSFIFCDIQGKTQYGQDIILNNDGTWYYGQSYHNDNSIINQIQYNQKTFDDKLNSLEMKLNEIILELSNVKKELSANKSKPKQNKRKPADPNYVHNIPQGDSYFMGNPNAKVTITEFYDFQ